MYQRAMAGSKLIAKHRSDKDPLQLDEEKSAGELTFFPRTNHNTNFTSVMKQERLSRSPSITKPLKHAALVSPKP